MLKYAANKVEWTTVELGLLSHPTSLASCVLIKVVAGRFCTEPTPLPTEAAYTLVSIYTCALMCLNCWRRWADCQQTFSIKHTNLFSLELRLLARQSGEAECLQGGLWLECLFFSRPGQCSGSKTWLHGGEEETSRFHLWYLINGVWWEVTVMFTLVSMIGMVDLLFWICDGLCVWLLRSFLPQITYFPPHVGYLVSMLFVKYYKC